MRVKELLLVVVLILGVGAVSVIGFWFGANVFETARQGGTDAETAEIQLLGGGGGQGEVIGGAAPDRLEAETGASAGGSAPLAQAAAQLGGLVSGLAGDGGDADDGPIAIDTLRVDPDGSAVIVGRAAVGEVVEVVIDGAVVAEGRVERGGDFVVVLDATEAGVSAEGPRRMTVRARDAEGAVVAEAPPVIVTPPSTQTAAADPADAAASAEGPTSGDAAENAGSGGPAPGGQTETAAASAAPRPLVFQERADGVAVIQRPDDRAPGAVSIDSVTYDDSGGVSIAGRGAPGADARLYLNDALEESAPIQPDGSWRVVLPRDVPPALYTLRVDQTSPSGVVTSRAETPFERANPADITIERGAVVVQPGNNLWKIASYVYGDGARFSVIYASNRAQIRDPNLIYPGQVFTLPPSRDGAADPAPR